MWKCMCIVNNISVVLYSFDYTAVAMSGKVERSYTV